MTEIHQFMALGLTVLTPNQRLVTAMAESYFAAITSQRKVVPTPTLLSLRNWLEQAWSQARLSHELPILLTDEQSQLLFQSVIANSAEAQNLLSTRASATLAWQAWQIQHEWRIDLSANRYDQSPDCKAYWSWSQQFSTICRERHFITSVEIITAVADMVADKRIQLPTQVVFACFDELTPAQQHLREQLKTQCDIIDCDVAPIEGSISTLQFCSEREELTAMAAWAKNQIRQGAARVGCVIPKLTSLRDMTVSVFNEQLSEPDAPKFSMTAGAALSKYPVIHAALALLQLEQQKLQWDFVSHLLRSPFINGYAIEANARARLDVLLRKKSSWEFSLQELTELALHYDCPLFSSQLREFAEHRQSSQQLPSVWAEYFSEQLQRLGWPGDQSLDSIQYQCVQRWLKLLGEFAQFDVVSEKISLSHAQSQLRYLSTHCLFAPKNENESIQVMGVLEAAGLQFDALWVSGLNNETWPQLANPQPFLPKTLQIQLQTPHSSAERELAFSKKMTERFCSSAQEIIFSYSTSVAENDVEISPLIEKFTAVTLEQLNVSTIPSRAENIFSTREQQWITSHQAPVIADRSLVSGGSEMLKDQALCPFRAFAHHRLHARKLETPVLGIANKTRGIVLHACLELFWKKILTHQSLCDLSDEQLNELISSVINQSLTANPNNLIDKIEKQRLQQLLLRWLTIEKQRPPFIVKAIEHETMASFAGIMLRTRVDRIDELDNGQQLVIDYKSSPTKRASWLDERPEEPQLPLYALTQESIDAIAFAQFPSNDLRFNGISDSVIQIDGIDQCEDWQKQLQQWRVNLGKIIDEFIAGWANTDPKNAHTTCSTCDLHSFCRISHENLTNEPNDVG